MKNQLYTFITLMLCWLAVAETARAQDMGSLCNGDVDAAVFGASGTLYDSGGAAGPYGGGDFFRYTLCNTAGCPLMLDINYANEAGYDFLEIIDAQNIYDVASGSNPVASNIYIDQAIALSLSGTGAASFTSTGDCVTILFSSDSSVNLDGFSIAWTSTCGTATANHTGDGANAPGPDPGNGSSPSNDFCGTPMILDSSLGIDDAAAGQPAVFTNINSTAGAGILPNGCDPAPSVVSSQSTLETTVYFQYCTGPEPGNFIDLGADNGAGGTPCVNYSIYQHLNDGDGSACFDGNFTEVTEGIGSLVPGQPLPPSTCWTFIIDGRAGAECDFRVWFREDVPGCLSTVDFDVSPFACSNVAIPFVAGADCSIPGTAGNSEIVDLFVYAPGGVPTLAPFGYENVIDISSPTETVGSAGNDPQGIEDKDPNLYGLSLDKNCTDTPTALALVNNTCNPFTVTYFLVVFDYNWDTDVDGNAEYDPDCAIKRFDITVYPEQPTVTVVPGNCSSGPVAYLQVGGNTCDVNYGLPASSLPCGTGTNSTTLNYSWTAADLELLLTGTTGGGCYTDLVGSVDATCAQDACPVICTPPTPTLTNCSN